MRDALIGLFTVATVAGLACLPLVMVYGVYGGGVDWVRAAVTAWEGTAEE